MAHDEEEPYASAESVAGLAREVDDLRRQLYALDGLPERVDDVASAVADLADVVTGLVNHPGPAKPAPTPAPSWLVAPTDAEPIGRVLDALCVWLRTVYLRYSDAGLSECWLYHPEVIEELLWLQHAWLAAYQGPAASVALAGDWHDRQRPGVVRRIKSYAGSCSRENHQTRPGWTAPRGGPVLVPGVDTDASTGSLLGLIVGWWATARERSAPEPPHDPTRDRPGAGRPGPLDPPPGPLPPYPGRPPSGPSSGPGGPEWGPWR